jgi:hypothetical protein
MIRPARLIAVSLLIAAASAAPALADEGADAGAPRGPVPRGPHAESIIYGVSYTRQDDADSTRLRGVRLLLSSWDETVRVYNGGLGLYVSGERGGPQAVFGAGAEVSLFPRIPEAPVRFGPRFILGVEHRRRGPDRGFNGLFGVGLEAGVWIGRNLLLALTADRELAFPRADTTRYAVTLRLARPRR